LHARTPKLAQIVLLGLKDVCHLLVGRLTLSPFHTEYGDLLFVDCRRLSWVLQHVPF
jgi:hypothetical protein